MTSWQERCPVCGAAGSSPFLERDGVPVHQNLPLADPAAARGIARGRLALAACERCGLVWNQAFRPELLSYGEDYENSQGYSPMFHEHVEALARHLLEARELRGCALVEVGCGKQAGFLRRLVSDPALGNRGVGFDPSYVGGAEEEGGRLRVERRMFSPELAAGLAADGVIARHVIEHVPEPRPLLAGMRAALAAGGRRRVFLETPCVEWILRQQVMWDFFYEHCTLFSAASLAAAVELEGFQVREVRHVFGGQYLWLEAELVPDAPAARLEPGQVPALARDFGRVERDQVAGLRARLEALRAGGRVALWGAGAKGTTLAHLIDPDGVLIDCLADVNPHKQGRFVPATGHPIVAPAALRARGVTTALLMNPNYRAESERLIQELGGGVRLLDPSESP